MSNLYFPVIGTGPKPPESELNGMKPAAHQLCLLIRRFSNRELTEDKHLVIAAQAHAEDMARRNYFAHDTPEGITPNERAEAAGYPLSYGKGNQIESIAALDNDSTWAILDMLLASPAHGAHILGKGWFAKSSHIGVGHASPVDKLAATYEHYYVALIA